MRHDVLSLPQVRSYIFHLGQHMGLASLSCYIPVSVTQSKAYLIPLSIVSSRLFMVNQNFMANGDYGNSTSSRKM